MSTFQRGDKVIADWRTHVSRGTRKYFPRERGVIGTVVRSDSTDTLVQWPVGSTRAGTGDDWWVSNDNLKLYKEENKMSEEQIVCADCGRVLEPDEVHELDSGRIVCEDCLGNYEYCECCEEYIDDCEVLEVDGEMVCESCLEWRDDTYFRCAECDEWHRRGTDRWGRSNVWEVWNGDEICNHCFEDYYECCGDCGRVFRRDDMAWIEEDNEYYCADCERRHSMSIHDYGYKPSPVFKTTHDVFEYSGDLPKDELFFGVELEIDKGNDREYCAKRLTEESEDIYCKRDGSLSCGIEIVTHPCTLEYHMNSLGWEKLVETARNFGFKSNDARTCGLHVHVGRKQLGETQEESDETVAKMVILVDRHWDKLVKFSRRFGSQLDRWASRPDIEYEGDADDIIDNALRTEGRGRYQALNLCNSATVEFRLFNGTLITKTIYATLQFVSNLCKYARSHSTEEVLASQWKDIIDTERYEELVEYCESRSIIADGLAPTAVKTVYKPKAGDVVKIIEGSPDLNHLSLRGHLGEQARVVDGRPSSRNREFLLEFFTPGSWHSNHYTYRDNRFYYVPRSYLELVRHADTEELELYKGHLDYQRSIRDDDPMAVEAFPQPEPVQTGARSTWDWRIEFSEIPTIDIGF